MSRLFISFDPADRDPYLSRFFDELKSAVHEQLPYAEFFAHTEVGLEANWEHSNIEAARTSGAMLSV